MLSRVKWSWLWFTCRCRLFSVSISELCRKSNFVCCYCVHQRALRTRLDARQIQRRAGSIRAAIKPFRLLEKLCQSTRIKLPDKRMVTQEREIEMGFYSLLLGLAASATECHASFDFSGVKGRSHIGLRRALLRVFFERSAATCVQCMCERPFRVGLPGQLTNN